MDTPDYYAILGVPFNADAAGIRHAFRQKVKLMHPDVAKDKAHANEAFIQLQEAYAVLSDPQRRTNYDITYARRRAPSRAKETVGAARPATGPDTWTKHQSALTVAELLQRAMREMATGRYPYARRDLSDVLAREPENADAMLLMGRLYRSEGRNDEWIRVLQEAVAKSPSNMALRLALNDALRCRSEQPFVRVSPEMSRAHRRHACLATGLMGGACLFLWGVFRGGDPIGLIAFAVTVPGPLVRCMMATAALAGWTLASAGFISRIDEELFWPDTHGRSLKRKYSRQDAPLGLAVPVLGLIHYFLAVAVIGILMLTRATWSRSLFIVTALAFALALAMAMAQPRAWESILFWCPGWLLFFEFCGWYVGEFFRI